MPNNNPAPSAEGVTGAQTPAAALRAARKAVRALESAASNAAKGRGTVNRESALDAYLEARAAVAATVSAPTLHTQAQKILSVAEGIVVVANHGLIVTEARRVLPRSAPSHVLDDVINEARAAFIEPLRSFDPSLGNQLSTHLTNRIRKACTEAAVSWIGVTRHGYQMTPQVLAATDRLRTTTGRTPSIEEVASEVGAKPDTVRAILEHRTNGTNVSLDAPRFDEDGATLGESIVDETTGEAGIDYEELSVAELAELVEMADLSASEIHALLLYRSLTVAGPREFAEIGWLVDMSRGAGPGAVKRAEAKIVRAIEATPTEPIAPDAFDDLPHVTRSPGQLQLI